MNSSVWHPLLVGLTIVIGVGLRLAGIDNHNLWVDEAESSINGLSILQHGVPIDQYLGLPIYENSLVRPWPESLEYEFRDTSYSDRGVAVYHGWFPLYAIALSQWLFGVTPDLVDGAREVRHDEAEMYRRTWVPRVPSVVFAGVFLIMMYLTAKAMAGEASGWAALVFATFGEQLTWFGYQARYYSATLAVDAICAWCLWRCLCDGRWRHILGLAFALTLLFYTHILSCIAVLSTAVCLLPMARRHAGLTAKVITAAAIFSVCTVPWIWLSGLATHVSHLPKARDLLSWPDDFQSFLWDRKEAVALLVISAVYVLLARCTHQLGARQFKLTSGATRGAIMTGTWLVCAYAGFYLLMPAASFFWGRMTMTLEVPGILLAAVALAIVGHHVFSRAAALTAASMAFAFLWLSGRLVHVPIGPHDPIAAIRPAIDELRRREFTRDTRFYSSPNDHLVWTYYTGLPVQSIAPIRKTFLDTYPGPIVYLERFGFSLTSNEKLRALANSAGEYPDDDQLNEWQCRIRAHVHCESLRQKVRSVTTPDPLPEYLRPAVDRVRQLLNAKQSPSWADADCPVMMRGFVVTTHQQWWQTFFYRFVDPSARMEEQANYANRFSTADVKLLSHSQAMFYVPPLDHNMLNSMNKASTEYTK